MEKVFILRSSISELQNNGRLAIYQTTDRRVSHLVIIDPSFSWEGRAKQEVFRCGRCGAFVMPDEKSKTKDGQKYHKDCKPVIIKKEEKEIANEVRGH